MAESRAHEYFEGVALAADGQYLFLDYFDADGPTRLCFRYTISRQGETWLATGRNLFEPGRLGKEIAYGDMPKDVLRDAADWVKSNLEKIQAREQPIFKALSDYSELLDAEKRQAYLQRDAINALANQRSFKF